MKQLNLIPSSNFPKTFGGSLLVGKRKSRRPLSTRNPIHMVLKAKVKRTESLVRFQKLIDIEIKRLAQRFEIKIYERAVNHDHIHLVLTFKLRESLSHFNRA